MEWISCIKATIQYVEDNIKTVQSIDEIAKHNHISSFYLQQGFQIMTGYSIGEYIRNRKLYLASLDILKGGKRIIDVALDYGYETHESFTKAYVRFHGFSPSKTISNKVMIHRFEPLTIDIQIIGGNVMDLEYKIVNLFPIKLIGFVKEFSFENSYKEIPEFWDEICEKHCKRIYSGLDPVTKEEKAVVDNCIGEYGVCIDCEDSSSFKYMIAGKYTGGEVPEGMIIHEFKRGEWAVFDCYGPCPEKLQELNTRIFKEWLPLNKDFELREDGNIEWYDCMNGEKSDPDYHTQIWIPIRRINR